MQVEGLLPNEQRAALVFNALQKFLFLGCAFTSLCNLQHLWHPSWIQSKVATFHLLLFWLRGALAVNCKVLQTLSRKTMKVPKRFQVPTIPRPTEPTVVTSRMRGGWIPCCDWCAARGSNRRGATFLPRCWPMRRSMSLSFIISIYYIQYGEVWRNMEKWRAEVCRYHQISTFEIKIHVEDVEVWL